MNYLSLKAKIIVLVGLPALCFLSMGARSLWLEAGRLESAKRTMRSVSLVHLASEFVHAVQKERGMSAGYLSGGLAIADLGKARAFTDGKMSELAEGLPKSSVPLPLQSSLNEVMGRVAVVRGRVDAKSLGADEAIAEYSGMVAGVFRAYLDVAAETDIAQISAQLRSLAILELARDSGGQLRANLTAVLSKNLAIPNGTFIKLVRLKSEVDANLTSKGLVLGGNQAAAIDSFQMSPDWRRVDEVFQEVLKRSETGAYGQDPKVFFASASRALDILVSVVNGGFDEIALSLAALESESARGLRGLALLIAATFTVVMVIAVRLVRGLTGSFARVSGTLQSGAGRVSAAASEIHGASVELSESSGAQASAVQETAASMQEIQAMLEKNEETTERLKLSSQESEQASRDGKQSVDRMGEALAQIAASNRQVNDEVERTLRELGEVARLISEIGSKTLVINDIVFQTKLLSFNASVEAARAGEHGKGFAVVAEEVGNLAQMSGDAAKEISEMLARSIERVDRTTRETTARVGALVVAGKDRLTTGSETLDRCGSALAKSLEINGAVGALVAQIAAASREQSLGVREIAKAMSQLDTVTASTAQIAARSAKSSSDLLGEAAEMTGLVSDLQAVVSGSRAPVQVSSPAQPKGRTSFDRKPRRAA